MKWGKKLAGWSERYFNPSNIALTHEDWTTICQITAISIGLNGCLAAIAACGTAETMTFGAVTVPCFWILGVLCNAHGAAASVLTGRCDKLMGMR